PSFGPEPLRTYHPIDLSAVCINGDRLARTAGSAPDVQTPLSRDRAVNREVCMPADDEGHTRIRKHEVLHRAVSAARQRAQSLEGKASITERHLADRRVVLDHDYLLYRRRQPPQLLLEAAHLQLGELLITHSQVEFARPLAWSLALVLQIGVVLNEL